MANAINVAIYILSFLMSFAVGANDAANSLGTLYGSRALKLVYIVLFGALFEFIGAVWGSGQVAGSLVSSIITDIDDYPAAYVTQMMLGSSIASFIFIMSSSVFGMPISGTHAVVGGLVGAGLVGCGASSIDWWQIGRIVLSWFVSPVLSMTLCFLLLLLMTSLTLGGIDYSFKYKALALALIAGTCSTLTCFMLIVLLQERRNTPPLEYPIALPSVFLLGFFGSRFLSLHPLMKTRHTTCSILGKSLMFWSWECYDTLLGEAAELLDSIASPLVKEEGEEKTGRTSILVPSETNTEASQDEIEPQGAADLDVPEAAKPGTTSTVSNAARARVAERRLINESFRYLMVGSSFLVSLAHGSNDVANAISALLVVAQLSGKNLTLPFYIGGGGIALGLACLGSRVMKTVGEKVVKLDYPKGFCAQFATAVSVILGSLLGLPLSTTHCMVGALFGIILANKVEMVRQGTNTDPTAEPDERPDPEEKTPVGSWVDKNSQVAEESKKANVKTIYSILGWWVATVPVTLVVSSAFTALCLINATA